MEIQKSLYIQLQSGDVSQNFFRVFHDAMDAAQAEIKSTVTVNTSDIAARANEENNNNNTKSPLSSSPVSIISSPSPACRRRESVGRVSK